MRGERLVSGLLRSGRKVRFRVNGTSMVGSIWPGDVVQVDPVDLRPIGLGDIALYECHGRLIAHRVVGLWPDHPGGLRWILRGDNLEACDLPVRPSQILGRVRRVQSRYAYLVHSGFRRLKQLWEPRAVRTLPGPGHADR
jgi:hypothetical protein